MTKPQDEDPRQGANLAVLGAALLIIALSVWALAGYKKSSARLDCFAAGHHDCAPIRLPDR